ncbi:helix-turn-helix domain-containing protein [Rahnella sp. SAP-1]|uniref:Helix-turn-helix domain-containing protein n=1 Tax=Rouxiella aceris TaxID=2703884 RepID=A0A848MV55_9GAMM|nr:helix-turn-helix domain-containing protein [Rouxiella aceris]NMP29734.1 helix-turn-helix domain-containing protein [Rouxiella aceris]
MIKKVQILAIPGVQLLDVSGPLDVFAEVNQQLGRSIYQLEVLAWQDMTIVTSSGVGLLATALMTDRPDQPVDTFLVAGAPDIARFTPPSLLVDLIKQRALQSQRFGSVCTGALLLAATGLLDGHRVTTHWAIADTLCKGYPGVQVDADAIYIAEGPLRTAAGVTSGLDLALMMVEEDMGREVAMSVAAQLVMFFKRPGGQMQFSRLGRTSLSGRSALQDLQRWVTGNLPQVFSVQLMAEHMGISSRHLSRLFTQELGISPGEWLEQEKISHARFMLESSTLTPKQIAAQCGYSSIDILRRAFYRQLNTSPAQYRKYFQGKTAPHQAE